MRVEGNRRASFYNTLMEKVIMAIRLEVLRLTFEREQRVYNAPSRLFIALRVDVLIYARI